MISDALTQIRLALILERLPLEFDGATCSVQRLGVDRDVLLVQEFFLLDLHLAFLVPIDGVVEEVRRRSSIYEVLLGVETRLHRLP